jgi:hypothetical protein
MHRLYLDVFSCAGYENGHKVRIQPRRKVVFCANAGRELRMYSSTSAFPFMCGTASFPPDTTEVEDIERTI